MDIVAAFCVALLAGMGVGGGGLLVLWLVLLRGWEQLPAQSMNLTFFIAAAAASMIVHVRKRKLDLRVVAALTVPACAGTFFGSRIAQSLEPETLRVIFGALMIAAGAWTLLSTREKEEPELPSRE